MSPEPSFPSSGRPCESAVLNAFMLAGLTSFARDVDFVSIAGSGLVTDIRHFSAKLHMMFLCLLGLDGLWTFCASGQTVVIEELVDAALSARCRMSAETEQRTASKTRHKCPEWKHLHDFVHCSRCLRNGTCSAHLRGPRAGRGKATLIFVRASAKQDLLNKALRLPSKEP